MSASIVAGRVYPGEYHDSVRLMRVGEALRRRPGVEDAGLMMGTPANKDYLAGVGLVVAATSAAGPDDLVVAVRGTDAAVAAALDDVPELLRTISRPPTDHRVADSVSAALEGTPSGSIGLVTVPGRFAARVAREFVDRGRHVMVFSDNVSLEEERELKTAAEAAGVIVMGPDAGTALLGGIALGFANRVSKGRIGIAAASGTGAQQIASTVDRLGGGISQIVGLGGRDLDDRVGGTSLWYALDALDGDAATEVVVVVAKKAGPVTLRRLLRRLRSFPKPTVLCLLTGGAPGASLIGARGARSLRDAAEQAMKLDWTSRPDPTIAAPPARGRRGPSLRGLFSGGTLAQEALDTARALLGDVTSNLTGSIRPAGHSIMDLGSDEFTSGRPHPMIDPRAQADAIAEAARSADTGVVLFDVVLGYGAHEDPASVHAAAIRTWRDQARAADRDVLFVASIVGTDTDPQSLARQAEQLRAAGCVVVPDSEQAAAFTCLEAAADDLPAPRAEPSNAAALLRPSMIVSVGSSWFTDALVAQRADVAHVLWRPPADLDAETERLLELLE